MNVFYIVVSVWAPLCIQQALVLGGHWSEATVGSIMCPDVYSPETIWLIFIEVAFTVNEKDTEQKETSESLCVSFIQVVVAHTHTHTYTVCETHSQPGTMA